MRQPRLHPLRSATWVVVIAVAAISCADNGSATKATPASTTRPASAAAREIAATGDLSATPPALSAERPGTLLRFQRITTPIAGSTAGPSTLWRVMYVSSDDAGAPVAVTGLVRVPDGRAPGAGWPVISWAHGTTGTADRCAPSITLDYPPPPDPMVADGIVIASTDYIGLGTPGVHPYLDGQSEGRAVDDIVTAAGQLPEVQLSGDFAVWGHSQGGHAALFARELAATRLPAFHLLGTVAMAPPSSIAEAMTTILTAYPVKSFGAMALAGIVATHPGAQLTAVVNGEAAAAIESSVDTVCSDGVDAALAKFGWQSILVAQPSQVEPWASALAADEPAMAPGEGPLLLVHSADDVTVPAVMSATVKARTCARGESTLRWVLPSGGHEGAVTGSYAQDRRWTLDRFARKPAISGCGSSDGPPS